MNLEKVLDHPSQDCDIEFYAVCFRYMASFQNQILNLGDLDHESI
jgi:hypothetical protein